MKAFFRRNLFPLLLFLLILTICVLNYSPHTFLSGWDTLHPEFDFDLNFKRLFSGVWRQEQGLGAVAGHSHMADLPRVIFLWLLHFIAPLQSLRYIYLFLCLFLGPLGMFYLVSYLTKLKRSDLQIVPFLASLFYLFNLSTVQQFFVPFEMFPTQYAFLPWILLFTLRFFSGGRKRDLILFSLVTIISTPQAYAAHLWYAFFIVFSLFVLLLDIGKYKKAFTVLVLTLLLNSFWLLPNLYYIVTSSSVPRESKQNRLFSQEFQLRNRENGYLKDVALIKGFYFNWEVYNPAQNRFEPLMQPWQIHMRNPLIRWFGYSMFTLSVLGLCLAFIRRDAIFMAFSPFFILPFIFLMNHTFPFDKLFDFLIAIPLSQEALRFVFTKFSILLLFSYVIYFSYALSYIFATINLRKVVLATLVLTSGLFLYGYPLFNGNLLSERMKVQIPSSYFSFWDFMKTKDQGTILALPLYNFAGWQYYRWGYQGAGFIWFGLKQPILDRDFDRWSVANEQAFQEFHYALYARQAEIFKSNLAKYRIRYIVWDQDILTPEVKNRAQILYKREIEAILTPLLQNGDLEQIAEFGSIRLFEVGKKPPLSEIKTLKTIVSPSYKWSSIDQAFLQHGDYISGTNDNSQETYYYPFRDILSKNERVNTTQLHLDSQTNAYTLRSSPQSNAGLVLPDYQIAEKTIPVNFYLQGGSASSQYTLLFKPLLENVFPNLSLESGLPSEGDILTFSINNRPFRVGKGAISSKSPTYVGQTFLYTQKLNYLSGSPMHFTAQEAKNISGLSLISKLPLIRIKIEKTSPIVLSSSNAQKGIDIIMEDIPQETGYILALTSKNVKGLPLRICLKNLYSNICDIYNELSKSDTYTTDYFLIPPKEEAVGYKLFIDNISYGNYESANEFKEVQLIPFPYSFLSQIYFSSGKQKTQSVFILNQSYHPGWKAYANGKELKNHVLINNWANGWILQGTINNEQLTVKVVYPPQRLQYAGFILLGLTLLFIMISNDPLKLLPNKKSKGR